MNGISLEALRRQALASGAELEIDGAIFNSGKAKIRAEPKAAEPVCEVEPVSPPALTMKDVTEMLAQRDATWRAQITEMTQAFTAALKSLQPVKEIDGKPAKVLKFEVTYDRAGHTKEITPIYEQTNDQL